MKFDNDEIRDVAEVLRVINPSAANYPVESLIGHMKSRAIAEYCSCYTNSSYLSTLGYVLTPYTDPGTGEGAIKASIAVYGVKKFLAEKGLM